MEDLNKVNSLHLYSFWKNFSIGLLAVVVMVAFTKLLPFYLSPVVSLICAAVLYTILYNSRIQGDSTCMVIPYSIFYCLISYCIVTIGLNVAYLWGYFEIPKELIFFNYPYIPALIMMPVSAVTITVIYFRRSKLSLCRDCVLERGSNRRETGLMGKIISVETYFQLRNLILLFSSVSVVAWVYYIFLYNDASLNNRDWYVFIWLVVIAFILDEFYFIFRYYNLYLDLKENDEIITADEIDSMSAKTYVRYYVVCGNYVYLDPHCIDPMMYYREVIDTPFVSKRSVNGMTVAELRKVIVQMTGVANGELRFFFGRRLLMGENRSLIRYFYFLDSTPEDYKELRLPGQWVDFEQLKKIYSDRSGALAPTCVNDITRLATIMLTEKTFDERGFRKSRIKAYNPTFNLIDVRKSNIDFQDDKWVNISMFNSDTSFYRFRRWWRHVTGRSQSNSQQWD